MLLHRNARDDVKCARKYGEDWQKYKQMVPYSCVYTFALLHATESTSELIVISYSYIPYVF